jgi:hypothetical protein
MPFAQRSSRLLEERHCVDLSIAIELPEPVR